jgi:hypothetical protein
MRIAATIVLFLALPALAADDKDKPAIRVIPTKDLKVMFPAKANVKEPTIIASTDELAKSPIVKDAADDLKKQIDFAKDKLVVFAWAGSGQDKLASDLKSEDKKTIAEFTLTRGLTRDLRRHIHLFAVPKDAEVKFVDAKK